MNRWRPDIYRTVGRPRARLWDAVKPEEYDAVEHLREEHHLGEPIAVLAGWLSMYRDGDVDLDRILAPLTRAAMELNDELLTLGRAAATARRPKRRPRR